MISFFISCVPRGQSRVRHTKSGIAYKSKEQRMDEDTLQALMMPHKPSEPLEGALYLGIRVHMPLPASKSKKWKSEALVGTHLPGKPDLDNVIKHVTDCMQSMMFFKDDKAICDLEANKFYSETPGYQITLARLDEL